MKERYILEIVHILRNLDDAQLRYIYSYILGYFDVKKDIGIGSPGNVDA